MAFKSTYLFILISLFIFSGCGDDYSGSSRSPTAEEAEARFPDNFSTRLNNELLVAGTRCNGGETTEINGQVTMCEQNQWLITVDNVNTCTDDGVCTKIFSPPFIGNILRQEETDINFSYFDLFSVNGANVTQQQILQRVRVKCNPDGSNPFVEFK